MNTSDRDLLRQCAASGQMDAAQIAAHQRAGELDQIAARTRRVQEHELRWSREIGYEGADLATRGQAEPVPARNWLAGRAVLLYAGTMLATALAALTLYLNA